MEKSSSNRLLLREIWKTKISIERGSAGRSITPIATETPNTQKSRHVSLTKMRGGYILLQCFPIGKGITHFLSYHQIMMMNRVVRNRFQTGRVNLSVFIQNIFRS